MADEDDLELRPAEAGALFRVEMAAKNFLLGHWKVLVAGVVLVLASILFYGQYRNHQLTQQRAMSARIAEIEATLPAPIIELPERMSQEQVAPEPLLAGARALVAAATESSGPARVEAMLKAAELFRLAESHDERRVALTDATEHGEGILGYSATGALANLELESGNGDAAVALWKTLAERQDGFLAERALLDLALTYEAIDRADDARATYESFIAKYPASARVDRARQRLQRLDARG